MAELTTLTVKPHYQPCQWDRTRIMASERQQGAYVRMGWKPKTTIHTHHTRVPSRQHNAPCRQLLTATSATPSVWVHNTATCRCAQDQASLEREDEALAASINTISAACRARHKQQLIEEQITIVATPPPRQKALRTSSSGKLVSRLLSSIRHTTSSALLTPAPRPAPSVPAATIQELADLTNGCSDLDIAKTAHYLFDRQIPINRPNHLGLTPLMAALRTKASKTRPKAHLAFLSFLLDCGADPNATFVSREGTCANVLSVACTSSCGTPVLRLLLDRGAAVDAPVVSGGGRDKKETKGEMGMTAVHIVVQAGNAEALEVLLGYGGGSVNKPYDAGHGGSHGAGEEPITGTLKGHKRKRSRDLGLGKKGGERGLKHPVTPLHLAHGNEACTAVLLRHGADPMARDGYGRTPLHWAAEFGKSQEVVELLLDAGGTDVNVVSDDGVTTPLHHVVGAFEAEVARGTHVEIVRMLVERIGGRGSSRAGSLSEGKGRKSEEGKGRNSSWEEDKNSLEGLKERLVRLEDFGYIFEDMFMSSGRGDREWLRREEDLNSDSDSDQVPLAAEMEGKKSGVEVVVVPALS